MKHRGSIQKECLKAVHITFGNRMGYTFYSVVVSLCDKRKEALDDRANVSCHLHFT